VRSTGAFPLAQLAVFRVVRKLFFVEEKLLTHSSHGDCCPDCARMRRSLPENVRSSRQALRGRRRPLVVQRNRSEDEDYLNADQRCSVHERCIPAGLCGQRRFGECVNHIFGSSSPGGGTVSVSESGSGDPLFYITFGTSSGAITGWADITVSSTG